MNSPDATDLEHRLRIIEDKLAIYELIAAHLPSADTGAADYTISVYQPDGVFDRGPYLTAPAAPPTSPHSSSARSTTKPGTAGLPMSPGCRSSTCAATPPS